jgi:hypothetical protein
MEDGSLTFETGRFDPHTEGGQTSGGYTELASGTSRLTGTPTISPLTSFGAAVGKFRSL